MGSGRQNNWRSGLQVWSTALLVLAIFVSSSSTLHSILVPVGLGGLLVYLLTDTPASRNQFLRFGIPLIALLLVASLLSIDPRWVIFGAVALIVGELLWAIVKQEHVEYRAERERPK